MWINTIAITEVTSIVNGYVEVETHYIQTLYYIENPYIYIPANNVASLKNFKSPDTFQYALELIVGWVLSLFSPLYNVMHNVVRIN